MLDPYYEISDFLLAFFILLFRLAEILAKRLQSLEWNNDCLETNHQVQLQASLILNVDLVKIRNFENDYTQRQVRQLDLTTR